MARILELNCYPIKGCAGTRLSSSLVTPAGLEHDRSFMVISEPGVFRSQRRDPALARIRPEMSPDGDRLTLRSPGHEPFGHEVDYRSAAREVSLFGQPYRGIDQGDPVAVWLGQVLGVPSRLVRVPTDHARITDGQTPGTCGYADSSPIHMVSTSSLILLNERIARASTEQTPTPGPVKHDPDTGRTSIPVPTERFRPNLVIEGWDEPHTEDRCRRIEVGDVEFAYAKLAIRCAVTMVDQVTGGKVGPEPLRTLATYRRSSGGVAFGTKFAVLRDGKLTVGDELTVHEWAPTDL